MNAREIRIGDKVSQWQHYHPHPAPVQRFGEVDAVHYQGESDPGAPKMCRVRWDNLTTWEPEFVLSLESE